MNLQEYLEEIKSRVYTAFIATSVALDKDGVPKGKKLETILNLSDELSTYIVDRLDEIEDKSVAVLSILSIVEILTDTVKIYINERGISDKVNIGNEEEEEVGNTPNADETNTGHMFF